MTKHIISTSKLRLAHCYNLAGGVAGARALMISSACAPVIPTCTPIASAAGDTVVTNLTSTSVGSLTPRTTAATSPRAVAVSMLNKPHPTYPPAVTSSNRGLLRPPPALTCVTSTPSQSQEGGEPEAEGGDSNDSVEYSRESPGAASLNACDTPVSIRSGTRCCFSTSSLMSTPRPEADSGTRTSPSAPRFSGFVTRFAEIAVSPSAQERTPHTLLLDGQVHHGIVEGENHATYVETP
jgi:hypothetical protein